jgi:hypothetical protein
MQEFTWDYKSINGTAKERIASFRKTIEDIIDTFNPNSMIVGEATKILFKESLEVKQRGEDFFFENSKCKISISTLIIPSNSVQFCKITKPSKQNIYEVVATLEVLNIVDYLVSLKN